MVSLELVCDKKQNAQLGTTFCYFCLHRLSELATLFLLMSLSVMRITFFPPGEFCEDPFPFDVLIQHQSVCDKNPSRPTSSRQNALAKLNEKYVVSSNSSFKRDLIAMPGRPMI